jgi:hypothetical protein
VVTSRLNPVIVSVSSVIDNSGVAVYWERTGETVDILWKEHDGVVRRVGRWDSQRMRPALLPDWTGAPRIILR